MGGSDHLSNYYLATAMYAMEQAYASNRDKSVGSHLSQAIDALHRLTSQAVSSPRLDAQGASDPYEIDDFNSAI
jgi:hypothetical protein